MCVDAALVKKKNRHASSPTSSTNSRRVTKSPVLLEALTNSVPRFNVTSCAINMVRESGSIPRALTADFILET